MSPSTGGAIAAAVHSLSLSPMDGVASPPNPAGQRSITPAKKGSNATAVPLGSTWSKPWIRPHRLAGRMRRRCSARVGNTVAGFPGSSPASWVTMTGDDDSPAITTAAREGSGRVSEDKEMMRTGSSAFVDRRKRCYPPGGGQRYGAVISTVSVRDIPDRRPSTTPPQSCVIHAASVAPARSA